MLSTPLLIVTMKAKPACFHCSLKQALSVARRVTDDQRRQLEVMRKAAEALLNKFSLEIPPAEVSTYAVWTACEALSCSDPFREEKRHYNRLALEMYPRLKGMVEEAEDRLAAAVKVAAAGNIIDLGILDSVDIEGTINEIFSRGFAVDHLDALSQRLAEAKRILYLSDNAGEIVFDKVLVEELRRRSKEVTFAVKEAPIINDVTLEDALAVGMDEVARVVSTGSGQVGTNLSDCSQEFLEEFRAADLIISKGQGNFETLSEVEGPIFFILKAKCREIAAELGVELGETVLMARSRM